MTQSKTVRLPLDHLVEGQLPLTLALDPGGTTGWALFDPTLDYISAGQISGEHHLELYNFLTDVFSSNSLFFFADNGEIVCESFQFRQFAGFDKSKVVLDSVEYIGVIKLYSRMTGIPIREHTASMGKFFVNDDKLERLGWYKPTAGLVHARDACRHLLRDLIVNKHVKEPLINKWITKKV